MKKIIISALCLTSFSSISGEIRNLGKKVQKENFKTGELKEFKLTHNNYRATFSPGDHSFGTKMIAEYKTKNISSLEDYAVVQYIKGCIFESSSKDGVINKWSRKVTQSFGEMIPFRYEEWTIDSVDSDPIYASTANDRHGRYRWNTNSNYNYKTEYIYRDQVPTIPKLYIRDIPGTTINDATSAVNISLKFKTCIMEVTDIPESVDVPTLNIRDKAIKCLEWDSSFIFNHNLNKYENKSSIDSFCM
jgi:hypothetical protein